MGDTRNFFCKLCLATHYFSSPYLENHYICKDFDWMRKPAKFMSTTRLEYDDALTHESCRSGTSTFEEILYGKCNKIPCLPGYKSSNGKCYQFESRHSGDDLYVEKFDQYLIPALKYLTVFDKNVVRNNLTKLSGHFGIILTTDAHGTDMIHIELKEAGYTSEAIDAFISDIIADNYSLGDNATFILSPNPLVINAYLFDASQVFPDARLCVESRPVLTDESSTAVSRYISRNRSLTYWVKIKRNALAKSLYACKQFFPVCQLCVLDANSRNHIYHNESKGVDNHTLQYNENGMTLEYARGNYIFLKDGRYVVCCDQKPATSFWFTFILSFEKYTLLVGSIASCTSYVIFLTSYRSLSELRNNASFCFFIKSIFLFAQDGLYFIMFFVQLAQKGDKFSKSYCSIISAVIHFCFLSKEIWSVFLAADVIKSNSFRRSFLIASSLAISATLSFLFVLLTQMNVLNVIYGGGALCRLQLCPVLVIFFIAPLVLCFIGSIGCYVVAFMNVNSIGEGEGDMSIIALKLTLLCSVSDGLAYIAESTSEVGLVFRVLYSLLKGFRGVVMLVILKDYILNTYRTQKLKDRNHASTDSGREMIETTYKNG